jgi:hypothetical protein
MYEVIATVRGQNTAYEFGPFATRTAAELCVQNLAQSGQYARAVIVSASGGQTTPPASTTGS